MRSNDLDLGPESQTDGKAARRDVSRQAGVSDLQVVSGPILPPLFGMRCDADHQVLAPA